MAKNHGSRGNSLQFGNTLLPAGELLTIDLHGCSCGLGRQQDRPGLWWLDSGMQVQVKGIGIKDCIDN